MFFKVIRENKTRENFRIYSMAFLFNEELHSYRQACGLEHNVSSMHFLISCYFLPGYPDLMERYAKFLVRHFSDSRIVITGIIKLLIFTKKCPIITIKSTNYMYMSRNMRFPTMWYVPPVKAQTSLHLRAVSS